MKIVYENVAFDADGVLSANGFWTTKARFARAGVQVYQRQEFSGWPNSDKIVGDFARVLRPEAVVFDKDYMQSFANVPITIEHARGMVTPENASHTMVGAAGSPVTREGDTLVVPVTIYDREAIEKGMSGQRKQLSAGYYLDIEYAPGVDPVFGTYDYILKSWKGNHITLTKAGKAGPDFYIGDKKMPEEKSIEIVHRIFDGVKFAFGEQSAAVFDRVLAERDAARAERDAAQAERDAALDKIVSDEDVEKRVKDGVEKCLQEAKDAQILAEKTEVVQKAFPGVALDGKSGEYISALYDAAPKNEKHAVNDRALDGNTPPAVEGLAAKARAKFIAKDSGRRG